MTGAGSSGTKANFDSTSIWSSGRKADFDLE
jgi:hypothetical protein